MVAIPTTSGTGSEATSFAVISDKEKNMKYPLKLTYPVTPLTHFTQNIFWLLSCYINAGTQNGYYNNS